MPERGARRSNAPPTRRRISPELSPAARAAVTRLMLDRQKIAAIKTMRQDTGVGLKEAKEAVEHLARQGRNAT